MISVSFLKSCKFLLTGLFLFYGCSKKIEKPISFNIPSLFNVETSIQFLNDKIISLETNLDTSIMNLDSSKIRAVSFKRKELSSFLWLEALNRIETSDYKILEGSSNNVQYLFYEDAGFYTGFAKNKYNFYVLESFKSKIEIDSIFDYIISNN